MAHFNLNVMQHKSFFVKYTTIQKFEDSKIS